MKNLIKLLLVGAFIMMMPKAKAQTVIATKDGNYISVIVKDQPVNTGKTFTDTKNNIVYPIYLNKKGKMFIYKKSKKTGKEFKSYLKLA